MEWDLISLFTEFMPHRHCFQSQLPIMMLYIVGHGAVASAYLFGFQAAVVATLEANGLTLNAAGSEKLLRFVRWCGVGHLGAILTLWWGYYSALGVVAVITGYVSWDFILSVRGGTERVDSGGTD